VSTKTGPATCPDCRRAKYLVAKRRYQQSEKGRATTRAREAREDVKEKRRQHSRSEQGRRNKAKYESTPKGKVTRAKAILKYQNSEHGKIAASLHHLRTKDLPRRIEQRRRANEKYAKSEKMAAKKRRDYARRKRAVVPSRPVTARDWMAILEAHHYRCHYCKMPFTAETPPTLDHVIPVSKGGLHVTENIVPACQSCNSKKSNKLTRLC